MKDLLKHNWLSVALLVLVVIWFVIYSISKDVLPNNVASLPGVAGETITLDNSTNPDQDKAAGLATYLTEKGYKLYGTVWCSHCQDQKEMFGTSSDKLNYIECSTPDGASQSEVCAQENIELYPTWGLPDGTKMPGVMTLQQLADLSGYQLN